MAFESYRDFIEHLDRAGELIRITQPVATELEITALADHKMKSPGGGKALLIEKPTVNGVVSPFPVAINTMGSHKRMLENSVSCHVCWAKIGIFSFPD